MSSRPSFRFNLLARWSDHVLGLIVGLALMPFVLHTVGDETYGVWLFLCSLAGYSGLLRLGFGEAIGRYVARHHARQEWDELNKVVNVILAVYAGSGAIAIGIAGVLAWLAPSLHEWSAIPLTEVRLAILLLGAHVAISIVGGVFGGVLIGIQRFDVDLAVSLTATILRLGLTFGFLKGEGGLLTLAVILLIVTIAENLIYAAYAFAQVKTLSFGLRYLDCSKLRECCSFSGFAFIHGIADQVINATDTVLIGLFFGAEAIVPYYVALRLCQFISKPIHNIGNVALPRAGELHALGETSRLHSMVAKALCLAFVLTMGFFIGAGFFGRALIQTWVGPGYDQSFLLLLVLLGSRIIATPIGVLRSVLFGMGQVRISALLYLAEAAGNLVLTLILIRPLGLMGVALGTAIPVIVVELGLLLPYALRELKFSASRLVREVLRPAVLPLMGLWGYSFAVSTSFPPAHNWLELGAVSLGGGFVLAGIWLLNCQSDKLWHSWKSARA